MSPLSLSLMLALLSLVAVRTLARRRQPTQPQKRKRVFAVVDTTQRLGIFGFAQSNVIYDFYQKEVNVFDACRLTYRPQVAAASWQGRPTRLRPASNAVERDLQVRRPAPDPREGAP